MFEVHDGSSNKISDHVATLPAGYDRDRKNVQANGKTVPFARRKLRDNRPRALTYTFLRRHVGVGTRPFLLAEKVPTLQLFYYFS